MVARRSQSSFQVVFTPDARSILERLPSESRNRVLNACESLAELAATSPMLESPECLPALASSVDGLDIVYDVVTEQQALWIRALVRR